MNCAKTASLPRQNNAKLCRDCRRWCQQAQVTPGDQPAAVVPGQPVPAHLLDVPDSAYSRATPGVYELTRVEQLRDLYVRAYARSTQEYLVINQELAEPDPTRLAYRDLIKQTVREVVQHPEADTLAAIAQAMVPVPQADRDEVQALVVQELRRLHEGVLARYGLRPCDLSDWKAAQQML